MEIVHLSGKKNIIIDLLSYISEYSIYIINSLEFVPDSIDIPDQNNFPGSSVSPVPPIPPAIMIIILRRGKILLKISIIRK
jgi:hypothetical protein